MKNNETILLESNAIINYCGKASYEKGKECASFENFIKAFIQENAIFVFIREALGFIVLI